MDERDREHQLRPSSPISPKSYDNTKERLSFVEEVVASNHKDHHDRVSKSPPLEFIEEEFHLTKSTEQLQEAGFASSHYNQMTKMQNVERFEEPMIPNLANSSDCIEISNYISRQSTQRDPIYHEEGLNLDSTNKKNQGMAP